MEIEPHAHDWGQLLYAQGGVRLLDREKRATLS
jgi:hypothetical protein